MSRYIDADKLQRHGNRGGVVYWRDIEAQPTADVVEVVRCKDCKYRAEFSSKCNKLNLTPMWPNDYCSYGERADT